MELKMHEPTNKARTLSVWSHATQVPDFFSENVSFCKGLGGFETETENLFDVCLENRGARDDRHRSAYP